MSEETIDTSTVTPEIEPVVTEEVEPVVKPATEPVVLTPPPLSQDEIMELATERAFQRMTTWIGRRDVALLSNMGREIDARVQRIVPSPPSRSTEPAEMLEDPDKWARSIVPRIIDEEISKRTQADQSFNTELIRQAVGFMDNDPLFADKELGSEVIGEITKNFGTVDKRFPPTVAAQLLVNKALANVIRQRTFTKTNPLAANKPIIGPLGTITAPVVAAAKPKPIKLSESAAALAKRWNYSPEDIARIFKE